MGSVVAKTSVGVVGTVNLTEITMGGDIEVAVECVNPDAPVVSGSVVAGMGEKIVPNPIQYRLGDPYHPRLDSRIHPPMQIVPAGGNLPE